MVNIGLASEITYNDKINSKVFFESEAYKMILVALKKDQLPKPHSASMNTPLQILEGSTKITIADKEHILKQGDAITLPKEINHGVSLLRM
ncbi:hypothetical protein [Aquimarina celericrescens]|uniref:Cupin n=1 Tax=Aquimarina celericrescens TaxID=1964542 RepID=A0ABW5AUU6_9FLAO|nr:hypothetical protein [Aquimarina celericrescens]